MKRLLHVVAIVAATGLVGCGGARAGDGQQPRRASDDRADKSAAAAASDKQGDEQGDSGAQGAGERDAGAAQEDDGSESASAQNAGDAAGPGSGSDDRNTAAASPPEPGTVRVVVVFADEALGSETRAIAKLGKLLGKRKRLSVTVATASDDERSAVAAVIKSGDGGAALPAEWHQTETVIALWVLRPRVTRRRGKKRRISRGLGEILVWRPPSAASVYRETVAGPSGVAIDSQEFAAFVAAIARSPWKGQE